MTKYQTGGTWSYVNPSALDPLTNLVTDEIKENKDEKWLKELQQLQEDEKAGVYDTEVLYDTRHVRDGLADLSHFSDPIEKYTEYGVPLGRKLDWNEIRANNQTTGEKWRRGALKALATTGGAIAENTVGLIAGVYEKLTGGEYFDNAIGRQVDRMNEHLREEMPNYYTKAEEEAGLWGRMGTANFWADKALNGLGYSLGSVATMALTGGVGYIGMAGRVAKGIKIAAAVKKASKIHKLYQIAKASKSGQGLANMMKGIQASHRLGRAINITDAAIMMSLAEASVESRETKKNTYDALLEAELGKLNLTHASQLPSEVLREVEKSAIAAGNTNFALNLTILSMSNALMFGKLLGPKYLGTKPYMPGKAGLQGIKTVEKEGVKETIDKTAKGWRKAYKKASPFLGTAAVEGTQEGFQYASNIFSTEYNTAKLSDKGAITRAEAASDAMSRLFGETDGLESIMLGIVTGGIMGGGGALYRKPTKARDARAKKVLDVMNTGAFLESIDKTETDARTLRMLELHDIHRQAGNDKLADQYRLQALMSDINIMHNNGLMDLYYEKLDDAANLSDEEFRSQFGYDPGASIDKHKIISDVKSDIETIVKRKESLDLMFPTIRTTGLPRLLMGKEGREKENLKIRENQILKGQFLNGAVFLDKVAELKNQSANRIAAIVPGITLGNLEKGADKVKESYDNKIAKIIEETEGVTAEAGLDDKVKAKVLAETIDEFIGELKQNLPANINPLDIANAEAEIENYYQTHAIQQELFEKWDRLQTKQGRQNYLRSALLDEKDAIRLNADAKIDELLKNATDPVELAAGTPIEASKKQKEKIKKEIKSINNIMKNTLDKYGKDTVSTEEIDAAIEDRKDIQKAGLPFKSDEQKKAFIELGILRKLRAAREEAGLADQTNEEIDKATKRPTGKPRYTAMIVDDVEKLKRVYKPKYSNEHYHHSTIQFEPENLEGLEIGKKHKLKILGRVTREGVDAILVSNSKSSNKYPHITLSTQEGISPVVSNEIIEKEIQEKGVEAVYYKPKTARYVSVTEGYVDTNDNIITEQIEETTPEEPVELQANAEQVVEEKGPSVLTGEKIEETTTNKDIEADESEVVHFENEELSEEMEAERQKLNDIENQILTQEAENDFVPTEQDYATAGPVFEKEKFIDKLKKQIVIRRKSEKIRSFKESLKASGLKTGEEYRKLMVEDPAELSRKLGYSKKEIEQFLYTLELFKIGKEKFNLTDAELADIAYETQKGAPADFPAVQTMEEMKAELEALEKEEQDLTKDLKEEDDECATGQTKLDL